MRHQDPVDLIRDRNPVRDAHQLPDGPNSASAEALYEEIVGTGDQEPTTMRRLRLRRVAALAAAFLVVSAGVAVATGVFSPDPADVETLVEDGRQGAEVHLPGWRPALKTEAVWCMYDLETGADTTVGEFPVGEEMTIDHLLAECGSGNDVGRSQEVTPTDFTLCEATFTDEEYAENFPLMGLTILEGDLDQAGPGFPVVLAWQADCETTILETSFAVNLTPMESLDGINRRRELEIGLKAASLQTCLTETEAKDMAEAARTELGTSWLLVDTNEPAPPTECHEVFLFPHWGFIDFGGRDEPQPTDTETPTTPPPSDN
jgi:hypothetical protein